MANISEILMADSANLLHLAYREPSITAYNRLEPRPRSLNFERSLRAEIRDPLWYLTRQWQMGEFESEDCGSAIDARVVTKQIHIDRISLKGNEGRAYDEMLPMEVLVERENIPFTHAFKIQVAQYFLQLHPPAIKAKYLSKYKLGYSLEKNKENEFRGQIDGLSFYIATKNRALDGEKIFKDIALGMFNTTVPIDPEDLLIFNSIGEQLKKWIHRQYSQPAQTNDSAWNPQQLDYQFSVAAPSSPQSQVVMRASHYHSGRVDWYDFDEDLRATPLSTDQENPAIEVEDEKPISFIPTAATFKGIPNPRFWEMEERQINFGKLNAKTTDHLLLVFAEFGLIHGNDWFVLPYKIPVNTLCEIKGLVVTDVFGERTLIQAANEGVDNDWQHWSMFNISNKDHIGKYNRQFFLPSTLAQTLESEPLEKINFIRDEMANMAWGIEDIIPDATGKGVDGNEAADKTGVVPPPIAASTANIRYVLGTTVPENWIPFIPVQEPGSIQNIRFQRAAMPKLGIPPKEVIKAKGKILTEVPGHYFINEEEIPYSGTIVTRSYQRTRWYNGKTYVWIGRFKETGRGEGNSDLRFDQIDPLLKEE